MALVDRSGRINPPKFFYVATHKVANSPLNGFVPRDGAAYGITTGAPHEWARLFTALTKQESGMRVGRRAPDGSILRFASTPRGERSFGPGQFNIGEYGLKTWDDVNNPARVIDAYINVADRFTRRGSGMIRAPGNRGMNAYFGSIRRPRELTQHLPWATKIASSATREATPQNVAVAAALGAAPGSFRAAQEQGVAVGPAVGSFRAAQEEGMPAQSAAPPSLSFSQKMGEYWSHPVPGGPAPWDLADALTRK